jgi:hypothetical protein
VSVDGWGAVVALVVGALAYLGVVQGIRASQQQSAVSDGRQRWWTALTWVWDNRTALERTSVVAALDALRESAETSTQALMLHTVAVTILRPAEHRPSRPAAQPDLLPHGGPDLPPHGGPDEQLEPADVALLLERIGAAAATLETRGL